MVARRSHGVRIPLHRQVARAWPGALERHRVVPRYRHRRRERSLRLHRWSRQSRARRQPRHLVLRVGAAYAHAHGAPQARHPPEGHPRGPAPGSPADPAGPIVDRQRRRLRRRLAGVGRSCAGDRRSRPPRADRHLRARSARDVRGRRGDARPARGDDLRARARARVHLCAGSRGPLVPASPRSAGQFVPRRRVRGRQEQRRVPRSDRLPRADERWCTSMRMPPRRS